MGTLADGSSQWMLLAGIALLTVVLLRRSLRHPGARRASGAGTALHAGPDRAPHSVRRGPDPLPAEVAQWQVEMHELARDLKGELDSKMRLLQLLIDQARCEAQRLQTLLARAESAHSDGDGGEARPQGGAAG